MTEERKTKRARTTRAGRADVETKETASGTKQLATPDEAVKKLPARPLRLLFDMLSLAENARFGSASRFIKKHKAAAPRSDIYVIDSDWVTRMSTSEIVEIELASVKQHADHVRRLVILEENVGYSLLRQVTSLFTKLESIESVVNFDDIRANKNLLHLTMCDPYFLGWKIEGIPRIETLRLTAPLAYASYVGSLVEHIAALNPSNRPRVLQLRVLKMSLSLLVGLVALLPDIRELDLSMDSEGSVDKLATATTVGLSKHVLEELLKADKFALEDTGQQDLRQLLAAIHPAELRRLRLVFPYAADEIVAERYSYADLTRFKRLESYETDWPGDAGTFFPMLESGALPNMQRWVCPLTQLEDDIRYHQFEAWTTCWPQLEWLAEDNTTPVMFDLLTEEAEYFVDRWVRLHPMMLCIPLPWLPPGLVTNKPPVWTGNTPPWSRPRNDVLTMGKLWTLIDAAPRLTHLEINLEVLSGDAEDVIVRCLQSMRNLTFLHVKADVKSSASLVARLGSEALSPTHDADSKDTAPRSIFLPLKKLWIYAEHARPSVKTLLNLSERCPSLESLRFRHPTHHKGKEAKMITGPKETRLSTFALSVLFQRCSALREFEYTSSTEAVYISDSTAEMWRSVLSGTALGRTAKGVQITFNSLFVTKSDMQRKIDDFISRGDYDAMVAFASDKLQEHKLTGWTFEFSHKVGDWVGLCYFKARRIVVSVYAASEQPLSETKDTILHEIAHALRGDTNRHEGHDGKWETIARRIGGSGMECSQFSMTVFASYLQTCPNKCFNLRLEKAPPSWQRKDCNKCGRQTLLVEL